MNDENKSIANIPNTLLVNFDNQNNSILERGKNAIGTIALQNLKQANALFNEGMKQLDCEFHYGWNILSVYSKYHKGIIKRAPPKSYISLLDLFEQAATRGHWGGRVIYSMIHNDNQNEELNKSIKEKAFEGMPLAQCALAWLYEDGRFIGVEQSNDEALHWYLKAANQDDRLGQYMLAKFYQSLAFFEEPENVAEIISLKRKAASKGLVSAQIELGEHYKFEDEGDEESRYWFKQAALLGSTRAMLTLGGDYSSIDFNESLMWYEQALQHGDTGAEAAIGRLYLKYGNFESAFVWLSKAVNNGNCYAKISLAELYEDGKGVDKNLEMAAYWYRTASEQEPVRDSTEYSFFGPPAAYRLGRMYETGQGVELNLKIAKELYSKQPNNKKCQEAIKRLNES